MNNKNNTQDLIVAKLPDGVELTQQGLKLTTSAISDTEADMVLEVAMQASTSSQWAIGDALVLQMNKQLNQRKRGKYKDIAEKTGYTASTIRQYVRVSRNTPINCRCIELSFHHYKIALEIQNLEARKRYLKIAKENAMSVHQFRAYLNHVKATAKHEHEELEVGEQTTPIVKCAGKNVACSNVDISTRITRKEGSVYVGDVLVLSHRQFNSVREVYLEIRKLGLGYTRTVTASLALAYTIGVVQSLTVSYARSKHGVLSANIGVYYEDFERLQAYHVDILNDNILNLITDNPLPEDIPQHDYKDTIYSYMYDVGLAQKQKHWQYRTELIAGVVINLKHI